jgi:molybdopterin-guanine dinucleotide biosynthesis protein B
MREPALLGLVGWSGAGKTTLLIKVLPLLVARGLRVATLKHAHHEFDVDLPGKDSYEHRRAGACEVIVSSARRWAHVHELGGAPEPSLGDLLRKLGPCDLVVVEGFKRERHPKLEVYRRGLGKPPLHVEDPFIRAIATDGQLSGPHPQVLDLNDVPAIADAMLVLAQPLSGVLARLDKPVPATQGL